MVGKRVEESKGRAVEKLETSREECRRCSLGGVD
jgi:hypothetical protein